MKLYFILRESVVDKLETNGKWVILYHYSPTNIKGNYLKVKNKPGLQSSAEFKSWGKERLFFYTKKRDYIYDKGISTDYLYVCRIEKNKIYPINENPNKCELPTHAKGDGMGFGFHRVCVIANV